MTQKCDTCGNDVEVAKIAKLMGFRPDIAFLRIKTLENFIRRGIKNGYINFPEN